MKLEMFRRMVVLFCFHSICVDSFNESDCDDAEDCIRICCDSNLNESSCQMLVETGSFEQFKYLSFPDSSIKFGFPCEKMLPVNGDEWSFEVIELAPKVLSHSITLKFNSRMEKFIGKPLTTFSISQTTVYMLQLIKLISA